MKFHVWFYNLATPGERHQTATAARKQVGREIQAMLDTDPWMLGLVECVGWPLPRMKGYKLVRDLSRGGRANIAAYIKHDLKHNDRWVDLHETWSKTQHPGRHEPRSILINNVEGIQMIVAHQPPRYTDNVDKSQQEGIDRLTGIMGPQTRRGWKHQPLKRRKAQNKRPRLLVWDGNRPPGDHGPGPDMLAKRARLDVHGHGVDTALTRNIKAHISYHEKVGGVQMKSDHHESFRLDCEVD